MQGQIRSLLPGPTGMCFSPLCSSFCREGGNGTARGTSLYGACSSQLLPKILRAEKLPTTVATQATPAASPFALMSFPVTGNVTAFPAGPPGSNPVSLPQSFRLESSMTAQIPAELYVSLSVRTPQPHNPRRVKHHCVQTRTFAPSGMTVLPFSGTAEAGWDPKLRTCASVYISDLVVCIADRYGE